jgi:Prokaryotic E2 family C/ThiF family
MALAEYFSRNTVAVAQIISGFDEPAFVRALSKSVVGIAFGSDTATSAEGRHLADMAIRLLARLYPTVAILAADEKLAADLSRLAIQINPNIEISADEEPTKLIAIGIDLPPIVNPTRVIYAGCDGWDAHLSETRPQTVGSSSNPFGAGAAAALACAKAFNDIFGAQPERTLFSTDVVLSTLEGTTWATKDSLVPRDVHFVERTILVGLGAIGNAAVWALSRSDVNGDLMLVDHETIELSNLQRYVLAMRGDEGRPKSEHLAERTTGSLRLQGYPQDWATFVASNGYVWDQAIIALDSARDRRLVQASLPRTVVNAWTQPGDLGVSVHGRFGGPGACVGCLYLPTGLAPSEDAQVAQALGIPERLMDVRTLLYLQQPVPNDLLNLVAERLRLDPGVIERFRGVPIRRLYLEGICGGTLIAPTVSTTPRELHVPIAHQSALAGILLAAAAIRQASGSLPDMTSVTRIDVMKPLGTYLTQNALADERHICICRDPDYVMAYDAKYGNRKHPGPGH